MRTHRGLMALAPLMVLCGAMTAQADTINISALTYGNSTLSDYISYKGVASDVFIGGFTTNVNGGTPFESFCIDLAHDFSPPTSWSTSSINQTFNTNMMDTDSSNSTAQGVVGTWQQLAYIIDNYSDNSFNTSPAITSAAIQIALWTVEYGSSFSVATGVSADMDTAIAQANAIVAAVNNPANASAVAASSATFFLANHGLDGNGHYSLYQDLIGPTSSDPQVPSVPEPSSVALVALGLGVVIFRGRKAFRVRLDG